MIKCLFDVDVAVALDKTHALSVLAQVLIHNTGGFCEGGKTQKKTLKYETGEKGRPKKRNKIRVIQVKYVFYTNILTYPWVINETIYRELLILFNPSTVASNQTYLLN